MPAGFRDEDTQLPSAALQNAATILQARQRAEQELLSAKAALEDKTRQLAHSLALLRATLESTSNAILAVDRQGSVTEFNQNFLDMWQLDRGHMLTASHAALVELMAAQAENAGAFRLTVADIEQSAKESLDVLELNDDRFIERFSKPQTIAGQTVGRVWSFRDISARRKALAALATSEARLRSTFNQAAVGMAIADLEGRWITVNTRLAQMFGYTREELQGRSFLELTHPADLAATEKSVKQLLAGEIPEYMLEKRYLTRQGRTMWGRTTVTVQREDDGRPQAFIGVIEDITLRRQAEVELHAREHELSVIYGNVSEVIFFLRVETGGGFRFVSVNKAFLRATGLDAEQVMGHLVEHVIPEPSPTLVMGHYREAIDGRRTVSWEETTRYPSGQRVGVVTVTPIFDDDVCINLIGTVHDISVRKQAELALREESQALELLNRAGTTLASNLDVHSLVQAATDAATELTGAQFGAFFYTIQDPNNEAFLLYTLSGAPREAFERFGHPRATALFGPTFRGEATIRIDDVLKDPRYGTMSPHHGMPPGHLPVRSYLAAPVITRSGEVLGGLFFGHASVGVFNERTERIAVGIAAQAAIALDNARLFSSVQKAAEEREALLERERSARAHAEKMSDVKDEFVATLSHELRTPLSAILGWSYILRSSPPDPEQLREGLETIERNARVQTQLIEDLLDMSRIVSGKVRLDVQSLDPVGFINAALETVKPAADARRIRIEQLIDPAAGPISGDPSRLQQVLWNLLSNAIKFTPQDGKVQVVVERVNSHIEIHVADTGMGIEPEFLPHVFERFRQADASTTRRPGPRAGHRQAPGALHGGTVQATSQGKDRGATFTVCLPLAAIQRPTYEQTRTHPTSAAALPLAFKPVDLSGLKVLVVDDEPDARDLIRHLLAECRADVVVAASAEEALELMDSERPAVLISDIGMPGTDGFDLLRLIRARGELGGGRIPAIALTAFARSEDRTRALRAGFQVHVSKPVEPTELVASVASVSGRDLPSD